MLRGSEVIEDEAGLTLRECTHHRSELGCHHVENQIIINGNLAVLDTLLTRRRQRSEYVGSDTTSTTAIRTLAQLPPLTKAAKKISARYQNTINENIKVLGDGNAQFEVLIFGSTGSKRMSVYSANQHAIARNIERLGVYLSRDPCTRASLDPFVSIPFPDTRLPVELCLNQVYINEMLFVLARGLDENSQPTREMRPKLPTPDSVSKMGCVVL